MEITFFLILLTIVPAIHGSPDHKQDGGGDVVGDYGGRLVQLEEDFSEIKARLSSFVCLSVCLSVYFFVFVYTVTLIAYTYTVRSLTSTFRERRQHE